MKLPKYVSSKKGSLHYQRGIPTRLRSRSKDAFYYFPLGLKDGASDSDIAKAVSKASEGYELKCKMITNSSPEAYGESEIDMLAMEILRKAKVKPGRYIFEGKGIDVLGKDNLGLASIAVDGTFDGIEGLLQAKEYYGSLDIRDEAKIRAFEKLVLAESSKPKTLVTLYNEYMKYKGFDPAKRQDARTITRIQRWMSKLGDQVVSKNTRAMMQAGLKYYAEERLETSVSSSTVKRELNDILAFINWSDSQYGYGWNAQKPRLPKEEPKAKHPLSQSEQKALVAYCMQQFKDSSKDAFAACIVLLELQGGMMASEVERLDLSKINWGSIAPYLIIDADRTKTSARKRLVPIVLAKEAIRANLEGAQKWLKSTTDTAHSKRIKVLLKEATGNDKLTAHCLRHSFMVNCKANGADMVSAAAIAGWSGSSLGMSSAMLAYGQEGLEQSNVVRGLYRVSLQIHKHLIGLDGSLSSVNKDNAEKPRVRVAAGI